MSEREIYLRRFDIAISVIKNRAPILIIYGIDKTKSKLYYKSGLKSIRLNKRDENYQLVKTFIRKANYLVSATDYTEAIGQYKKALNLDPKNYEVWSNLGYVYFKFGKLDESVRAYENAEELGGDYTLVVRLSLLLLHTFEHGNYEVALKVHSIFYRDYPERYGFKYLFGYLLEKVERYEEAYIIFNELLQSSLSKSNLENVLMMLISLLLKLKDYKQIIQLCRAQLGISPNAKLSMVKVGTMESTFLKAELFNGLSIAYNKIREFDNAIIAAKNAINLDKSYAPPWAHLGYAYYKQGKKDVAFEYFNQFLIFVDRKEYGHFYLGMILYEMKNYRKAQIHCEEALDIDPEFEEALTLQKKLSNEEYKGNFELT